MFGMRHHESRCEGRWAAGRWGRGRDHGMGRGGRHGMGGMGGDGMDRDDRMRARRMLASGDLRLIALALIEEQPRHGYEIIKLLEDKTSGWYAPSPGVVYPTLTYLEETGYVTSQADGAKKLYTITGEGRAHLEENRDFVNSVLDRFTAIGEKIARMRQRQDDDARDDRRGPPVPPLVKAALDNLRAIAAKRIEDDAEAETRLVEILARAAADLRKT